MILNLIHEEEAKKMLSRQIHQQFQNSTKVPDSKICLIVLLMPSSSADSKFVLSIPKIFKHTQVFNYTQNVFGILKSGILLHKLDYLSILKTF